jgi:asparagine synthase (glutamine-hydrolysing)
MCGFAGVIAWDERYCVSKETLAKMSAAIAHRGPDGEGFHIHHDQQITPENPQVALAFRRLAILDPDPRSNQPFTDGRHWLVFNGEIYNFRELKKELSILKPEYEWRTTGDTEVLLCAYAVWGEKCVEHLNGMFAFAVWDEVEKSLFLARDRMGQKPLYFAGMPHQDGWVALAFASEVTALYPLNWIYFEPEPASLLAYLRTGFIPAPYSIYDGMNQLMPGMTLIAKSKASPNPAEFLAGRYFDPAVPKEKNVSDDPVEQTRKGVFAAIRSQMVSDVPIGCFLSGGIDSSIVASCMTRATGLDHRVATFSIGFDDTRYDELPFAQAVAKHLGTEHHSFRVTPNALLDLPKLAAVFGEPFGDSSALPTHYLSMMTRAKVKVALSGDGADELFGGYDRYRALEWSDRLSSFSASRIAAKIGRFVPGSHPKSRGVRARRFLTSIGEPPSTRYLGYTALFSDSYLQALWPEINRGGMKWQDNSEAELRKLLQQNPPAIAATAFDRKTYLPNDLLTKVDRCSMLHGLEVRSPFMDHELVQFAAGLSTDQLLKGGPKRMLREAFRDDLPAWVFKRKKMGFAVPIGDWFRGPLRAMLRDTLFSSHAFGRSHFDMKVVERLVDEHESKRVDHSQRLYALLMLELWWNTVHTGVSA